MTASDVRFINSLSNIRWEPLTLDKLVMSFPTRDEEICAQHWWKTSDFQLKDRSQGTTARTHLLYKVLWCTEDFE